MTALNSHFLPAVFISAVLAAGSMAMAGEMTPTQQLWKNSLDAEKEGNYKKSLEYNAAILREADSYYANLRAGWLNYLLRDYDAAIRHYSRASILAPGAIPPLMGLSNCYQAGNDTASAIRVTGAVLILDPANFAANKRLAELYWSSGEFGLASAYYLKLSNLYPEDLDLAASLAWCYLKLGRNYEASIIFNNVLIVNPDHHSSREGLKALEPAPKRPALESETK